MYVYIYMFVICFQPACFSSHCSCHSFGQISEYKLNLKKYPMKKFPFKIIQYSFVYLGVQIWRSLLYKAKFGMLCWHKSRKKKNKTQALVSTVEEWANRGRIKVSVAKTRVICFARRHKEVSVKFYGQTLEQLKVILIYAWWKGKQHIDKIKDKCKNVLRCLSSRDWGETRTSLLYSKPWWKPG